MIMEDYFLYSPWPDRIEIKDIVKINSNKYMVNGDIVEITSVPNEEWRTGITLAVERFGKDWFITGLKINQQNTDGTTSDKNYIGP